MPQQAHIIAQRLLNLYRQEHVIEGGWAAVNKVFIAESNNDQVIAELEFAYKKNTYGYHRQRFVAVWWFDDWY